MAKTEKSLVDGIALTNALVTYYTATAPVKRAVAKDITICNTDTAAHTVTINVIKPAGSAGVLNTQYSQVTIQAGETKTFGRSRVIAVGGFIQAKADAGALVSLSIDGYEVT